MRAAWMVPVWSLCLFACGPARVPSSAGAEVYAIDPGVGLVVSPGQQAGYGITANVGGSYRVVWTGDSQASGSYRRFTGTIWTTGGFSSVTPGCGGNCPLESGDFVSAPEALQGGTQITFDTVATDGLDGVDFIADVEPVYMDLLIDGSRLESLVFFSSSGQASNPATMPFGLQTQ